MILLIALSTAAGFVACGSAPAGNGSAREVGNQRAAGALWNRGAPDVTPPNEAENPRILDAAWAAETNRRLLERLPDPLAAIYGGAHDDPDAILLRFIAALNAIHGSLGLSFATGAG